MTSPQPLVSALPALAAGLLALAGAMPALAQGADSSCGIDRPIVFAGLDYDSAAFHNAVAGRILETGYGCKVDSIPGTVIPLLNGLNRGDVDVVMEVWTNNPAQPWVDGEKAGQVVSLGVNYPDATEAWFVPRYLVEGPDAPAKDLRRADDLGRYAKLFEDPEEPGKGRFYNCLPGWQCELVNTKKLKAYGLDDDFTNFRPGSGEALAAAIESALKRQRPIVFYYWGPTWLLGKYDLVKLEEPAYDPQIWQAMMAAESPDQATAYPTSEVIKGANAEFAKAAPNAVAFLESYRTDSELVSRMLAYMRDEKATPEAAAEHFIATEEQVWSAWVPADVAQRIKSGAGR